MIFQKPTPAQERYLQLSLKMEEMESAAVLTIDEVTIAGDKYTIVCDKWVFPTRTEYEIDIKRNGDEIYREVFKDLREAVETITETINKIYERATKSH